MSTMKKFTQKGRALSWRSGGGWRGGTATVEFALVAPVLIVLLLGTIDVGQYVNVGQTVSNASREAARLAAKNETTDVCDVEGWVLDYLEESYPNVSSAVLLAGHETLVTDGNGNPIADEDLTNIDAGSPLAVQVVFNFDTVRWLSSVPIFEDQILRTVTTMRRE